MWSLRENESSGMIEELFVQAFKIFGTENYLTLVCNFSSNNYLWSFAKEANLLSFIATAFSLQSNNSAFFFAMPPSLH